MMKLKYSICYRLDVHRHVVIATTGKKRISPYLLLQPITVTKLPI